MKLSGIEPIIGTQNRVVDYWSWAHSILLDNLERAIFAKFLVHTAMKSTDETRINWDKCDIVSPEGINIEVKASGYIQTWEQEKLSNIVFSIRPTDAEELSKQADIYVFCVHAHSNRETVNVLDTSQWKFYIISTTELTEKIGNSRTITLKRLITIGAKETDYADLRESILNINL